MSSFWNHVRWELRFVFRRKAAWTGFAVILGFQLLFFTLIQLPEVRPAVKSFFEKLGYAFSGNFTSLTAAHFVLMNGCGFLASAFPAFIACESIAGDVGSGMMRLVLCRPVSRLRILGAKLAACTIYLASLAAATAIGALLIASMFEPWGPMIVQIQETGQRVQYSAPDGLWLYLRGLPFNALAAFTWLSFACLFSSRASRGSTAIVTTIALFVTDDLLRRMPFFSSIRSWFVGSLLSSWERIYEPSMDWTWVPEVCGRMLAIDAVLLTVAALLFARRDFNP
ncbi:MAG: hypothetical protein RL088_944 [Verrucomicrobiota bacterium]